MPNAYTAFVVQLATQRGLSKTGLADAAGLSKQVIGGIWNDDRDLLKARPDPKTIAGLSKALVVPEVVLWQKVVEAMGIPLAGEATLVVELETATNADILRVLARRLEAGTEHGARSAEKSPGDDGDEGTGLRLVDDPKPDDGSDSSDGDETLKPAADRVNKDADETPGGSDHRE